MEAKIIKLYKQYNNLSKVSRELNISRKIVTKVVKDAGIQIPKHTYIYNEDVFNVIDTEEKAYWLGLLFADGCIYNCKGYKTLEITLKSTDVDHLKLFGNFLCGTDRIVKYKEVKLKGKIYPQYKVAACNKKICTDLISLGLVERKSLIAKYPNIPNKLQRHFIRGFVDGDGGVSVDRGCIYLVSGSQIFIDSVIQVIKSELNIPEPKVHQKKNSNAFQLYYYGDNCKKVLDWLYSDCNVALKRKQNNAFAVLGRNI